MRIRITKTVLGSWDRLHQRQYLKGEEHDVPSAFMDAHLARDLLSLPAAVRIPDGMGEPDSRAHVGPEETKPDAPEEVPEAHAKERKPAPKARRATGRKRK